MPMLERWRGVWADRVAVFGRVPFFFYMLHLPLIHLAALLRNYAGFGVASPVSDSQTTLTGDAPSLLSTYLVWGAVILVLYPLCRRYADYKQAHRDKWWLSYL